VDAGQRPAVVYQFTIRSERIIVIDQIADPARARARPGDPRPLTTRCDALPRDGPGPAYAARVVGWSGRRRAVAVLASCAIVAGCGARHKAPAPSGRDDPGAAITVVRHERRDARLQDWTLRTPALDGVTRVRILLPAGYRAEPRRRYPVLYLLHGAYADYRSWTRYGDAEAITARAPLIVVMPDGGTMGWYTDWYEGAEPVRPKWETYHVGELVPWVDAHFRTVAARRGRAIAGLSMGGYGALGYAARHPGTFAAAASFSGALEIGSGQAWGPRGENEGRWRAHLPIFLARRLRSLALLEVRTGNGQPGPLDRSGTRPGCGACRLERFLHPANVRLHERLRRLGIPHVWDDGPGTHDWPYWRRDLRATLPGMIRVLTRPG
jgi:diacylglycerol O-acyltransferase / trehalose O-mycolyltransferase